MSLPEVRIDPQDFGLVSIPADTSSTFAVIGVSSAGTANLVKAWDGPNMQAMKDYYATGPLVENAAYHRSIAGGSLITCRAAIGEPGVAGTVVHVGTGVSAMTITGTPLDGYSLIVEITRSATNPAAGTSAFRYSLDGGTTFSGEIAIPTSGSYALTGTGLTLAFSAATLVDGDTYASACTAPAPSLATITAAIDALLADPRTWGWLHIIGAPAPTVGAVTKTPVAEEDVPDLTTGGTATAFVEWVIRCSKSGAAGTAEIEISADNGLTFGDAVVVPTDSTPVPCGSGVTVVCEAGAAAYVSGQTWTFNSIGGIAALFAAVDAKLTAAEAAFRYAGAILELPNASDAILLKATANLSSERIMYAGGFCSLASMTSKAGQGIRTQSDAWPLAARRGRSEIHVDLGRVIDGSLEGVSALARDENSTPGFGAGRIATLRTLTGYPGYFAASDTNGDMMAPPGSDYALSQHRAIMDRACTVLRALLLPYLNREIALNPKTGKILETEARAIEGKVAAGMEAALLNGAGGRHVSGLQVRINREEAILTTKNLSVDLAIVPLGTAKTITATVHYATNL